MVFKGQRQSWFLRDKDSLGFLIAGGFSIVLALLEGPAAFSGSSSNIDNNSVLIKSLQLYPSGGWSIKLGLTISSVLGDSIVETN